MLALPKRIRPFLLHDRRLVSGPLSGTYIDELKLIIHPNGRFNAHSRCKCTVDGAQGILELVASDRGFS